MGSPDSDGKRGEPAAVEHPAGCKRASWKFKRKPGAEEEDGWQVPKRPNTRKSMPASPELKVQNRYQTLEVDSMEGHAEEASSRSVTSKDPTKGRGVNPHRPTSTHTGNGVVVDGGPVPFCPIPPGTGRQSRRASGSFHQRSSAAGKKDPAPQTPAGGSVAIGQAVSKAGVQQRLNPVNPEGLTLKAPEGGPAGQSVMVCSSNFNDSDATRSSSLPASAPSFCLAARDGLKLTLPNGGRNTFGSQAF